MNDHATSTVDYGAVLRRRRWLLIIPSLLGPIVGAALAIGLPREYVASATLAVSSPSLGGNLAVSTPQDLAERIRAVSQQLLSQPLVEQVASDERLLDKSDLAAAVADIRSRTTVALPAKTIAAQAQGRFEPDAFIVSYTGRTPELAQRVTNRLVNVFVDTQSRARMTKAEETASFLSRQVAMSRQRLSTAEARLREVKATHQGRLPEQSLANIQAASDLRRQIDTSTSAISTERERMAAIDQQLTSLREDAKAAAAAQIDESSRTRLATLEQQLAEARLVYTPRHPEIQRLEGELARAKTEDEAERGRAGAAPSRVDPAERQLLADRETARLRVRELESGMTRLQSSLGDVQQRLDEAPAVEQRLLSLSQEYEFEKAEYDKVAERHRAALMNEELERKGASSQFVVLYEATRPTMPSSPNVPLLIGFSILAGLVAGMALAMAAEFLDRAVHDQRALQEEFGAPVLAEIPHF